MKKTIFISFIFFFIFHNSIQAFPLIEEQETTVIELDKREDKVVQTTLEIFSSDMELVSGRRIQLTKNLKNHSILIGTIGKNRNIDQLISSEKISVEKIQYKWEAFQIQIITQDNKKILVIAGSDSRGTAYGILELSRLIGVSPWVWWADSTPQKQTRLDISDDYFNRQEASVQYRGIFLNDEDWGLMPWSSANFEPSSRKGQIGSKTYAKIFELLLRLRANTLWPAMHESTVPFYNVERSKEMANKYGIVIGTSHCEPLMRNNAGEWDKNKLGDYNYLTNNETVQNYWIQRLKEAGRYENYYTVGMRGVHDGKIEGVKTLDEQTTVLSRVIKDQRELLAKYVNKDITKIPQSFTPYKEVLSIYENGLDIPEDVTLTWCDDNYGYITRLSNKEEKKRSGGAGIYYHVSYWGRPHDYLWLCTTSPAQIYWQMKKAWDTNARKLWILNVGDIKPAEYVTEFFMDMAWNIEKINEQNIYGNQEKWCEREFGKELSGQISSILCEYYRLANIRKPEFMGWSRVEEYSSIKNGRTPVIDTEFNPYAFGDEIYNRLKAYNKIAEKTNELEKNIPENKKAAYFQLVQYPICASAEMNKKLLYAQKARLYASHNLPVANEYAEKSINAYNAVAGLTDTYNKDIMKGKWDRMMDMKPRDLYVFQQPSLPEKILPQNNNEIFIWLENQSQPIQNEKYINLTQFINPSGSKTFMSVLSLNGKSADWNIKIKPDYLNVYEEDINLVGEKRICFEIDKNKIKSDTPTEECILIINNKQYTFRFRISDIKKEIPVEYNNLVIINTADYEKKNIKNQPQQIQGLGYSRKALQLNIGKENAITYKIYTSSKGNAIIRTYMIPNHPVNGNDIRYAISVDDEEPQIVSFKTEFRSEDWKINVLRNQSVNITHHNLKKAGEHSITIYAEDEGVILDQMMLDFKIDRKFYEIPVNTNN